MKFSRHTYFACHYSEALHILFYGQSGQRSAILQPKVHSGRLNADGFRFAIIVSRWNDFLTSKLVDGAVAALESLGVAEGAVEIFKVPGSFELPLTALKAAESQKFDAVIALGIVIRGETPHFDFVAGEAAKGITQASLKTGVPVLFGVITADTVEQAMNRSGLKAGNKGFEAAMSAIEVASLYSQMADGQDKERVEEKVF